MSSFAPPTTRSPRFTRVSDGKPFRRLLLTSKAIGFEVFFFDSHDPPPYLGESEDAAYYLQDRGNAPPLLVNSFPSYLVNLAISSPVNNVPIDPRRRRNSPRLPEDDFPRRT